MQFSGLIWIVIQQLDNIDFGHAFVFHCMMSINDCLILSVDKCTVQREDDFKEVDFRGRCYFGMLQHTSCYAEEILESHFF